MRLGVAIPSHARGNIATSALLHINTCPLVEGNFAFFEYTSSMLTLSHNKCLCWGLNEYRAGRLSHLLLLHSDIKPQHPHWIEVLITEMQNARADALGCFIPIKNPLGLTSTAIDTDEWLPQRLTLREAKALPVTWTANNLLLNTGLLLIDLAAISNRATHLPYFMVNDRIEYVAGTFTAYHQSEDWNFSRQCSARGLRLFVTRAVGVEHSGISIYSNNPAWGIETDNDSVRAFDIQITDTTGATILFQPTVIASEASAS